MRNKYAQVWLEKKKSMPSCFQLLHWIFPVIHSEHKLYNSFDGLAIPNTLQSVLTYANMAFRSKTFITYLEKL